MTERRYTETEVADIFQRATEAAAPEHPRLPTGEGMTLAELQEIGREVGIAPEQVARAAQAVERTPPTERRVFGFPIGVGRTVELGRRISDEEWERLVVDLRETFDAAGKVSRDGTLRQWTNGNLHAYLEPGANGGHRLRMRTVNAGAQVAMFIGFAYAGLSVFAGAMVMARHGLEPGPLIGVGVFGLLGLTIAGLGVARLPGWARLRLRQMEEVGARLLASRGVPTDEPKT